ncbi:putative RNA-binding protein C3H8.09c like [Verticillium longisporum]|nr:putative RNA-binding protein C3H8.09c like [Verticillium longisporum]
MPGSATPEIQATAADLSPVSPNPVHTVAPVVLPALQDTADMLDAMTEMPSVQEIRDAGLSLVSVSEPAPPLANTYNNQNINDNDSELDSLDEAYKGEEGDATGNTRQNEQEQPDAVEDDYLKSFDSPVQDELDTVAGQHHVSQAADSHTNHLSSDLLQNAQVVPDVDSPTTRQPPAAQPASQPTADTIISNGHPESANGDAQAIDISRLVAEMTAQADEHSVQQPTLSNTQPEPTQDMPPSKSASLPPKPPVTDGASLVLANPDDIHLLHQPHVMPNHPTHYATAGATGNFADAAHFQPALAPTSINAPPRPSSADFNKPPNEATDPNSLWEAFNADERKYMAEARWDKFPEGSRIFIGNLSSERVSKRDVFNIFRQYGPLAQISLKSAYGFVQYHTMDDAQGAMQNLQGAEVKGRKIHLEISRAQKKKGEDRNRSPDRGGRGGGRDTGRDSGQRGANGSNDRRGRDDRRQGRPASPRAGRDDGYGRDRGYQEPQYPPRGRSRTPPSHARHHDSYRRRSPSPANHRSRGHDYSHDDRLPLPRRHGSQIPDVQFLLLQEVNPEFVDWASRAFLDRGLKIDVMFLHPSMPRDAVIQRQVVEGVHAVVDLDIRANTTGRFSLRVFDRSSSGSTRFDEYQELEPHVAAELVVRAKTHAAPATAYHAPAPAQAYGGGGYGQQYPPQQQQQPPAHAYPSQPSHHQVPPGPAPSAAAAAGGFPAELLASLGHLDGATLQQLVAAVQNQQGAGPGAAVHGGIPQQVNGPVDVQAVLNNLRGGAAVTPGEGRAPAYGGGGYPPNGPGGLNAPSGPGGRPQPPASPDSASQVNTIMAQLAKFRQ